MRTQTKRAAWGTLLLLVVALALAACAPQVEGVTGAGEEEAAIEPEVAQPTEAPTDEPEPTEAPTEMATEAPMTTNAVEVEDQALGEDNTVTVARVVSDPSAGWSSTPMPTGRAR